MFKKIKDYIVQEKKGFLYFTITLTLVTLAFFAYLYLVGVPMTQAQNYYNQAYLAYHDKNYVKAKEAITNSLNAFPQQNAKDLQLKIDQALSD